MKIDIGAFDHMDRGNAAIHQRFAERLDLIEAMDKAGFWGYHVAEHHQTSLGIAPSPGIFLSAVIQRTRQMKIGPLVYILPAYAPLRLIEEICMLDHLSKGRYQIGVGQGVSTFELAFHGIGHLEAQSMYREALEVVIKGLTSEILDHKGEYYRYIDTPMILRPYQEPHPPLWYGIGHPGGAVWPAENGVNIVCNAPAPQAREITDTYQEARAAAALTSDGDGPKMGLVRHVFVGESDAAAIEAARPAYRVWKLSHVELWRRFRADDPLWPEQLDEALEMGVSIVGSPATVREKMEEMLEDSGCNYFVGRFAFGDLTYAQLKDSLDLFAANVMPHFQ